MDSEERSTSKTMPCLRKTSGHTSTGSRTDVEEIIDPFNYRATTAERFALLMLRRTKRTTRTSTGPPRSATGTAKVAAAGGKAFAVATIVRTNSIQTIARNRHASTKRLSLLACRGADACRALE